MKYSFVFGVIALAILATAASAPTVDCDGTLPDDLCKRLQKLEKNMAKLVKRSMVLVTKAVEESAQKNADLFVKTIALVNSTSPKKPMNASELAELMEDIKETFDKAEAAREKVSAKAMLSIKEAALKIASLVEKIIAEAADDDHSDLEKLKQKLKVRVTQAHNQIRIAAFKAIGSVHRANAKIEKYVARILKKLGHSEASAVETFVNAVSEQENNKLADAAESEMEADFDGVAEDAFELIALADGSNAKRGALQDFWNRIKSKLIALKDVIIEEVKKAVAIMWPQIKAKLTEIVQIILNTAKQAIVNIAGEMILVTIPPSIL